MAVWHTPETARDQRDLWPDVDQLEDETLALLLDSAREQVIAYAPALPADTVEREELSGYGYGGYGGDLPPTVPGRYVLAQLRHAKNSWDAARAGADGSIGGETFAISPRPLDWHVKNILRPARARPRVR